MPEPAESFDLIAMGRIGIDLHPLQTGIPLARVESFGRSVETAVDTAVGLL